MAFSAVLLALYTTWVNPTWWRSLKWKISEIGWGVVIAAVLWGIFWTGNWIASRIFDFASSQVDSIYGMKAGESSWLLAVLLLLLIGPAEEIFWRGYIQRTLSAFWNPNVGFIVATFLYASVHVASCNFMLVMAALVAGGVWGLCYRLFPNHLGALIISHALWDVAVFLVFPI